MRRRLEEDRSDCVGVFEFCKRVRQQFTHTVLFGQERHSLSGSHYPVESCEAPRSGSPGLALQVWLCVAILTLSLKRSHANAEPLVPR